MLSLHPFTSSAILAVLLVSQGVVQTFNPYITAQTLDGANQTIPLGPAASQIAIKMLGSNGGGFFNVNSAHPFENPNSITNLLETLVIILLPMALVFAFGYMVRNFKQGLAIFAVMMVLFVMGLGVALWSEDQTNPLIEKMGVSSGNLEGKEVDLEGANPLHGELLPL